MRIQASNKSYQPLRVLRARSPGQSIPLIALMIVVLVGMVGLSADVGNTYRENRHAERAANAAAVAGMQAYLESNWLDSVTASEIESAIRDNGFTPVPFNKPDLQPDELEVEAFYLKRSGEAMLCKVGECGGGPVVGAAYIQVVTRGRVDTYFARALGQTTLPINAQAFAGKCPPINGVLPITIQHSLIDGSASKFADPDGDVTIPDLAIKKYVFKRLYVTDPYLIGENDVGFLRWKKSYDNPTTNLPEMMAADGNLKLGFEEVTWGEISPLAPPDTLPVDGSGNPDPSAYPLEPFYLAEQDWAYGYDNFQGGNSLLNSIQSQLDFHIQNRSKVYLPLYGSLPVDDGSGGFYYFIEQFGEFYILDYDKANGSYIDLIFLRYAPRIPCPAENVWTEVQYGLSGPVELVPRWAAKPKEPKPAGYSIMLDVSGSMSWNFRGWAHEGATVYQCEAYDPDYRTIPYIIEINTNGCSGFWKGEKERRAYVSRDALIQIAETMTDKDRLRIAAFSSSVEAISSKWYDRYDINLHDHIRTVAECCHSKVGGRSPSYLTDGGTNGASALKQAQQFMTENFPRDPDTGEELKRVAIYMTDGVSNVVLDGHTPTKKPECENLLQSEFINTASCQIGFNALGEEMPIEQMRRFSREMHQDFGSEFQLYVLAMGRLDTTGLDQVATSPSMLYAAREAEQVKQFLEAIRSQVQYGDCYPQVGDNIDFIQPENEPNETVIFGPGNPPRSIDESRYGRDNIFGYVRIFEPGQVTPIMSAPIIHRDGQLQYFLDPNEAQDVLAPGLYEMEAWLGFNTVGDDGDSVKGTYIYDQIINRDTGQRMQRVPLRINPRDTLGKIARGPSLLLDLNLDADVCEALSDD